jgi:ACS family hexuronate transporter-like MFS transporter
MGIFTALVAGPVIDSFGTCRATIVIMFLIGVLGMLRGLATDFWTLFFFSFLYGFVQPTLPVTLIKISAMWFSPRQLGMANGIISAGFAAGLLSGARLGATVLSPALGGWRGVIFVTGVAAIVVALMWFILHPRGRMQSTRPFDLPSIIEGLRNVTRFPALWLISLVGFSLFGLNRALIGYVPTYLREIGWKGTDADTAISLFFFASLIGVIPLARLSDWLSDRYLVLGFAALSMTTGALIMFFANGTGALVLTAMIVSGMCFDGFMATHNATLSEIKGLEVALVGTAVGFALALRNAGAAIAPPLANGLTEQSLRAPFLVWAAFGCLALVILFYYHLNRHEYAVSLDSE